jgi:acylphosphatase
MKKAVKINIKGSVQGVFYRKFVKEHADNLNLKGFVRNLEKGGVEVFVEGEIEDVDNLCEKCKEGPKHSVIKECLIEEQPFQDFEDFKILHI